MPRKPPTHKPPRLPVRRDDREYDRQRREADKEHRDFCSRADWRRLRVAFLAAFPVCGDCGRAAATDVDHVVSRRKRPDLAFEWSNLRALCKSCHSRTTATRDGGWGHAARVTE